MVMMKPKISAVWIHSAVSNTHPVSPLSTHTHTFLKEIVPLLYTVYGDGHLGQTE